MGEVTGIQWCHHSWNGWWGCQEVSEGCHNCYAETLSKRWGYDLWGGAGSARRITSAQNWNQPREWNKHAAETGVPERVFAFSMSDVFEQHPALTEPRTRFFALVDETPHLRWQLLTKRPEHVLEMIPPSWREQWPAHVWLLTSAENHRQASLRLPWLLEVKARTGCPIIGVSAEPLLGPIDFETLDYIPSERVAQMLRGTHDDTEAHNLALRWYALWKTLYDPAHSTPLSKTIDATRSLSWIITGGESGPHHRPMEADWVRSIRNQCGHAGIAHFFKQWGGATPKANGKELDGREWCEFPDEPRFAAAQEEEAAMDEEEGQRILAALSAQHDNERVISAACAYRQACRVLSRNAAYGTVDRTRMAEEAIRTLQALFVAVDALERA